jgi:hypothetical protein
MPAPSDNWHWFRYPYLNEGDTLEKHREVRSWLKANHFQIAEVTIDSMIGHGTIPTLAALPGTISPRFDNSTTRISPPPTSTSPTIVPSRRQSTATIFPSSFSCTSVPSTLTCCQSFSPCTALEALPSSPFPKPPPIPSTRKTQTLHTRMVTPSQSGWPSNAAFPALRTRTNRWPFCKLSAARSEGSRDTLLMDHSVVRPLGKVFTI